MSEQQKKVYFAGPIHQQPDSLCKAWRHTATTCLRLAGCEVLDPMAHDYRGREEQHAEEIVSRDQESIELSDVLLVNANAASWGTAMEIAYAAVTVSGRAKTHGWITSGVAHRHV